MRSAAPESVAAVLPGAPFVAYRDGRLMLEDVPLHEMAQAHGTPLYVYSKAAMLAALAAYQRGLAGRNALICYALKANSTLAVLKVFADAGCGFDIVSGGELERALAAGGAPGKIVFSGIGKTRAEIRRALEAEVSNAIEILSTSTKHNEMASVTREIGPATRCNSLDSNGLRSKVD